MCFNLLNGTSLLEFFDFNLTIVPRTYAHTRLSSLPHSSQPSTLVRRVVDPKQPTSQPIPFTLLLLFSPFFCPATPKTNQPNQLPLVTSTLLLPVLLPPLPPRHRDTHTSLLSSLLPFSLTIVRRLVDVTKQKTEDVDRFFRVFEVTWFGSCSSAFWLCASLVDVSRSCRRNFQVHS